MAYPPDPVEVNVEVPSPRRLPFPPPPEKDLKPYLKRNEEYPEKIYVDAPKKELTKKEIYKNSPERKAVKLSKKRKKKERRCFWTWPIGHLWENIQPYTMKCRYCGKVTELDRGW